MSTLPLVAPPPVTLADVLADVLDDTLVTGVGRCLWCGDEAAAVVADRWTGRVVLRCPCCGSELEGEGRQAPVPPALGTA